MSEPDIVERLRAHDDHDPIGPLAKEAATEIESLRAAIDEMRQLAGLPPTSEIGQSIISSIRLVRD